MRRCNRYTCLMVSSVTTPGQVAPGELELVRTLLNTWLIPNDSRRPTDVFGELAHEYGWSRREADKVRLLRDDLRAVVESGDTEVLNGWVGELQVRLALRAGHLTFPHSGGAAGDVLVVVLGAIEDGTWRRLKACPDCRWVFYDSTRNASKRWCLMYAGGPDGRACGTIAKVRRYRERWATISPAEGGSDRGQPAC